MESSDKTEFMGQKLQYKDFSEWQNTYLKSDDVAKQEAYWTERFSGEIPILNMPLDYTRPAIQEFGGDSIDIQLSKKLSHLLNEVSQKSGATLYMTLLSAVNILLSKYTGQEDIIIGSPIAGRHHADLADMLGMFVNTLAMRNYPLNNLTYAEFLNAVKENSLKAYENQDYQFEELIEKLELQRDMSRNPLFDVMFVMQNVEVNELEIDDLKFTDYIEGEKIAKFDLTFTASETEKGILINIGYCTSLFKKETIKRMSIHMQNVLEAITANGAALLGEINLISLEEKNEILYKFNDTDFQYPKGRLVYQFLEEHAEKSPDSIALIFDNGNMTYGELNKRSNQIARLLREKGIKVDSIVGILAERSFEMIIGIFGILKSGGAYLPIDPKYPEDRIKFMLQDSGANILLAQPNLIEKIAFDTEIINLEDVDMYKGAGDNLEPIGSTDSLAYLIYTSGSTGKPKAVMVEHKAIVNRLNWMQRAYPLSKDDVILQKTSYTFDVSLWELIWWSFAGAKVCLLKQGKEKEPEAIMQEISKSKVTVMHFVPSMLTIFLEHINSEEEACSIKTLKRVFSSGEALSIKHVSDFNNKIRKAHNTELINLYGPTEAAVDVTHFNTSESCFDKTVPIGKPIDNTTLYVLGSNNILNPVGVAGELNIAGVCLARGYLNRPELTSEKFVENPFKPGDLMYKTGDLVKWLPDGNIEFLGRIDHQVKIRGFRIELGEIESKLLEIDSVKDVLVMDRADSAGYKYLCAYIVSLEKLSVKELRSHLSKSLPEYMIPSYFVRMLVDQIPLNSSGKIDRKALPNPEENMVRETEYTEPRNQLEKDLAVIWESVLGLDRIGIHSDFFEMGGNSLKLITLARRVNSELELNVPVSEFYAHPNISYISEYINANADNGFDYSSIDKNMVLLKKGKKDAKSIFFVQPFSGKPEAYTDMISKTVSDFNFWGIRHEKPGFYDPFIPIVEKMAAIHIEKIKTVQPKGPYYLAGWCVGGMVAYELAAQLEKMGEEVKFLAIFNTTPPFEWIRDVRRFGFSANKLVFRFTVKTEIEILQRIIPDKDFVEKHIKMIREEKLSIEELWIRVANDLEKIDNYEEVKEKIYHEMYLFTGHLFTMAIKDPKQSTIEHMVSYFNLMRGYKRTIKRLYYPKGKINCKINYFIAENEEQHEVSRWARHSKNGADYYRVDGADHFSMFEDEEHMKQLACFVDQAIAKFEA